MNLKVILESFDPCFKLLVLLFLHLRDTGRIHEDSLAFANMGVIGNFSFARFGTALANSGGPHLRAQCPNCDKGLLRKFLHLRRTCPLLQQTAGGLIAFASFV